MNLLFIAAMTICQVDSLTFDEQSKIDCVDFIVNCAVPLKGKISKDKIKECERSYKLLMENK